MPNIYQSLASYQQGYRRPTSALTPEQELELKLEYSKILRDYAEAQAKIQTEGIRAYSNVSAQFIAANARLVQAYVSKLHADASAKMAGAEVLRNLRTRFDIQAELEAGMPSEASRERIGTAADVFHGNVAPSTDLDSLSRTIQEALNKGETDADLAAVVVADSLEADLSMYAASAQAAFNQESKPSGQWFVADGAETTIHRGIKAALSAQKERLAGDNPEIAAIYTPEFINKVADIGVKKYVQPHMTDRLGGRGGASDLQAQDARQTASDALDGLMTLAKEMGRGGNLPRGIMDPAIDAINDMGELVTGGPIAFAKQTSKMPVPTYLEDAITELKLERDQIGKELDPMSQAIHNYSAIPGFIEWTHAMRFPNLQNAVVYASHHPGEFVSAVRLMQKDPQLMTDTHSLRGVLAEEGRRRGTFGGFYTRKLERAFGMRVPIFRRKADETRVEFDWNLDGLPEDPEFDAIQTKKKAETTPEPIVTTQDRKDQELINAAVDAQTARNEGILDEPPSDLEADIVPSALLAAAKRDREIGGDLTPAELKAEAQADEAKVAAALAAAQAGVLPEPVAAPQVPADDGTIVPPTEEPPPVSAAPQVPAATPQVPADQRNYATLEEGLAIAGVPGTLGARPKPQMEAAVPAIPPATQAPPPGIAKTPYADLTPVQQQARTVGLPRGGVDVEASKARGVERRRAEYARLSELARASTIDTQIQPLMVKRQQLQQQMVAAGSSDRYQQVTDDLQATNAELKRLQDERATLSALARP